jgi:hypothetical protein
LKELLQDGETYNKVMSEHTYHDTSSSPIKEENKESYLKNLKLFKIDLKGRK